MKIFWAQRKGCQADCNVLGLGHLPSLDPASAYKSALTLFVLTGAVQGARLEEAGLGEPKLAAPEIVSLSPA
eukprot:1154203-Pelagomonas_calceolata.AAC.15